MHMVGYSSAMKKKILSYIAPWIELEDIELTEISHYKRQNLHVSTYRQYQIHRPRKQHGAVT